MRSEADQESPAIDAPRTEQTPDPRPRSGLLISLALAILLPAAAYLWLGDRQLDLADEGFLWYGVQRTIAGEVPLRDFQAYDPGRYHWCAAFAPLFGQGLLGVRKAIAVFQGLGLLCALLSIRRVARGALWQLVFALLFMLWMFPLHKLFESALASMVAWAAVRLLERPSTGRHLVAGLFVGLAGYFGRNLGLYSGLALLALVLLSAWKRPEPGFSRRAGAGALGVFLGYAPVLGMLLFVPGFATSFADSLRALREHGANLPLPWPWPWRIETEGRAAQAVLRGWMESLAFLLPVIALPGLLVALLRTPARLLAERAACLAPTVVGLFFLHHASVRSSAQHLAQCIQPVLLALIALPLLFSARRRLVTCAVWGGLTLVTLGFTLTSNPMIWASVSGQRFVEQPVAGETLKLMPAFARYLSMIERSLTETVGAEELFIAPNLPGLYCVVGKASPSWWIYLLWKASPEEQAKISGELSERGVRWALVERGSFGKTHDQLWRRFTKEWHEVPAVLPPELALFSADPPDAKGSDTEGKGDEGRRARRRAPGRRGTK